MRRVQVMFLGIFAVFVVGIMLYPAQLAYTEWLGQREVATITDCHPAGKTVRCRGTWVGSDGQRHTADVDDTDWGDIGRQVPIRLGPWGPRAETSTGRVAYLTMFLVAAAVPVIAVTLVRAMARRAGAVGARLLATAVPPGAVRLLVNRRRVARPDAATVAVLRPVAQPAGYALVAPPGRVPHRRSGSVIEGPRRMAYNPTGAECFLGAGAPDGRPLFVLHRTPTGEDMPETAVLDPAGTPRMIVRRVQELPQVFVVLAPDGQPLGRIDPIDRGHARYTVRAADGREVGVVVAYRRATFIVEVQEASLLREAAIAFAADAYRLRL